MGGYDIRLSDWTLLFRWTGECGFLFGSVGDVAHTSTERQRTHGWRVAAARWGTRTLRSFCARYFERTFSRPLDWSWAHWHLRHHCHGHLVVLTLLHQTIRCGVGRVAARRYNNNNEDLRRAVEDVFRTNTPKMLRRMSHRTWRRIRLCPASRCTYGFTGHVTKAYVSDSNQIMVAFWSVYGDFSPTLYIYYIYYTTPYIHTHTHTHTYTTVRPKLMI